MLNDKLLKRIKLDKAPVFCKKGNERQYRHNKEVKLKLTEARSALDETPPAVEKAKTAIEEGEKLISDRQKHIRIADRSENGWVTVEEYVHGTSYTTIREAVLQKIEAIGLDKQQYGRHSLRAGGASAAAKAGMFDRMFKRHG